MKTKLEMEMAGVWLSDGRADKGAIKIEKKAEKAESKVKKAIKKVLGKKKK